MSNLTILITTLGRPTLLDTLRQLSSWRDSQPLEHQGFDITIFHNSRSSSSRSLTPEIKSEILKLDASLFEGNQPLEGAELSFRQALTHVEAGYVLPLSDDNLISEEGLKLALEICADGKYSWVHFNSITNNHVNYLIHERLYETSAEELVSRIGLNYSLCCISRSLFRVEMIDLEFWDNHIRANRSVFSWSLALAKSFQKSKVAFSSIPIEIRTVHDYDTSMAKWYSQWKRHSVLNQDGFLYPFTIHLSKMYESVILEKIAKKEDMQSMVVMEGNILKPLYVEMTNLSFLHAYKLEKDGSEIEEFIAHLKLMMSFFPKLRTIYEELNLLFSKRNVKRRLHQLRKIEYRYREVVGLDGFKLNRIMGDSQVNILEHPLGYLYVQELYRGHDWRQAFFVFSKSKDVNQNTYITKQLDEIELNFNIERDSFYHIDIYHLVFPNRLSSRVLDSKLAYKVFRILPHRFQDIFRSLLLK